MVSCAINQGYIWKSLLPPDSPKLLCKEIYALSNEPEGVLSIVVLPCTGVTPSFSLHVLTNDILVVEVVAPCTKHLGHLPSR
jgi:hypothetical protein